MTDPWFGWGVERSNAAGGPPFLLGTVHTTRKEALRWILETYGSEPNREAAVRRHRAREGVRAVRVRLSAFGVGRDAK